jgi:hypothetical protein
MTDDIETTCQNVLLMWIETGLARARLKGKDRLVFQTHHIYEKVIPWGRRVFDTTYSPVTYIRRWRELRGKDADRPPSFGIDSIGKKFDSDDSEAKWIVTPNPSRALRDHENSQTVAPQ